LSWKLAINRFSDHTEAELHAYLGYKRVGGRWDASSTGQTRSSFLQADGYEDLDSEDIDVSELASEVDWQHQLLASASRSWVKDQGACGSCWAASSTSALEMQMERQLGVAKKLSHQQVVDCTPNPNHCGGTGGCHGATGELAYEYARRYGVSEAASYETGQQRCSTPDPSAVRLASFVRLPENKASHLLHAVATKGPTVVSAEAGGLFAYHSGVYSGCKKDATVTHAMVAVGYGNDPTSGKDYWLIQNSWSADWGEDGRMRMERHMEPKAYCGTDYAPRKGVFCDNAPATVPVCGMCGIESDSVYPILARPMLRLGGVDGGNLLSKSFAKVREHLNEFYNY
jgi:cathepsin L